MSSKESIGKACTKSSFNNVEQELWIKMMTNIVGFVMASTTLMKNMKSKIDECSCNEDKSLTRMIDQLKNEVLQMDISKPLDMQQDHTLIPKGSQLDKTSNSDKASCTECKGGKRGESSTKKILERTKIKTYDAEENCDASTCAKREKNEMETIDGEDDCDSTTCIVDCMNPRKKPKASKLPIAVKKRKFRYQPEVEKTILMTRIHLLEHLDASCQCKKGDNKSILMDDGFQLCDCEADFNCGPYMKKRDSECIMGPSLSAHHNPSQKLTNAKCLCNEVNRKSIEEKEQDQNCDCESEVLQEDLDCVCIETECKDSTPAVKPAKQMLQEDMDCVCSETEYRGSTAPAKPTKQMLQEDPDCICPKPEYVDSTTLAKPAKQILQEDLDCVCLETECRDSTPPAKPAKQILQEDLDCVCLERDSTSPAKPAEESDDCQCDSEMETNSNALDEITLENESDCDCLTTKNDTKDREIKELRSQLLHTEESIKKLKEEVKRLSHYVETKKKTSSDPFSAALYKQIMKPTFSIDEVCKPPPDQYIKRGTLNSRRRTTFTSPDPFGSSTVYHSDHTKRDGHGFGGVNYTMYHVQIPQIVGISPEDVNMYPHIQRPTNAGESYERYYSCDSDYDTVLW